MSLFGGIASAVGSIAGGALGLIGSSQSAANAAAINQANYEHQKEFAQNGIRWKVADAKAAGLHPLAALGATTASYTPSAVVGDSPDYSFLSDAGQHIGRAIDAKRTQKEREEQQAKQDAAYALDLEGKQLDNEHRRLQNRALVQDMAMDLARNAEFQARTQGQVPAMPSIDAASGTVIPGQGEAYATGEIAKDVSTVPTSVRGDPTTQAGTPADSRVYMSTAGRVVLPNEATGDVLDAVPGAGLQYAVRNSVIPYLANFLPINDPRRRSGEYFDILTGAYRRGGRFRDYFGY